jgi:hypothetical protein
MFREPLFPDRDLTPAEEHIFGLVAADAAVREHAQAHQFFRYWTDPAERERKRARKSAAASRAQSRIAA